VSNPLQSAAGLAGDHLRLRPVLRCAQDIDKCVKTLNQMAATDPAFPPFVVFGNRRHIEESAWEAYKKVLLERGLATRPFPKREASAP
jgi:hypothetical protein